MAGHSGLSAGHLPYGAGCLCKPAALLPHRIRYQLENGQKETSPKDDCPRVMLCFIPYQHVLTKGKKYVVALRLLKSNGKAVAVVSHVVGFFVLHSCEDESTEYFTLGVGGNLLGITATGVSQVVGSRTVST